MCVCFSFDGVEKKVLGLHGAIVSLKHNETFLFFLIWNSKEWINYPQKIQVETNQNVLALVIHTHHAKRRIMYKLKSADCEA